MKGTDPSKKTQCDKILAHLSAGKAITPLDALDDYGCFRLGARIHDLRAQGYEIDRTMITVKNRDNEDCTVAEYRMPRQLTSEARAERENFDREDMGCSCHISPPCGFCTDPGNPFNQEEDDSCWIGGDA